MSRWRRYQQASRTAVFCDQLAERSLWPFRRVNWEPEPLAVGLEGLSVWLAGGRQVQVFAHAFISDDTMVVMSSDRYLASARSPRTSADLVAALALHANDATRALVSPAAWARLMSDASRQRTYDAYDRQARSSRPSPAQRVAVARALAVPKG